jgi:hypothetical protein
MGGWKGLPPAVGGLVIEKLRDSLEWNSKRMKSERSSGVKSSRSEQPAAAVIEQGDELRTFYVGKTFGAAAIGLVTMKKSALN